MAKVEEEFDKFWPEEGKKEPEIDGDEDNEAEEVARLIEGIKRDAAKRVGLGSAALLFLSRYVGDPNIR